MPDVTWIPVDEKPPRADEYWVWDGIRHHRPQVADWSPSVSMWLDPRDDGVIEGVTHYAEITYPEPPEEA